MWHFDLISFLMGAAALPVGIIFWLGIQMALVLNIKIGLRSDDGEGPDE